MVQPKYNPQESLERVKLMMKYDTSKTLNENKQLVNEDYTWLLPDGTIKAGTEIAGKIPKGAKAFTSMAAAEEAAAALGGAEAAAAGIGGFGLAELGAAASVALPWVAPAVAVAGLGYWLYDSINNGMPTASKVESFFNSCSTQSKNLKQVASDSQIVAAAEKINKAIEGLGTDEDAIKSAIESMGNVADLCALKTKYDARYGSLYEDLDGDIDGTDWKTYVWAPMQTIIEKSAEKIQKVQPIKTGGKKPGIKWRTDCTTYSVGCKSDAISKVQACLGGLVTDGKYGSKTQAKLKEIGYNSFTDSDIDKICNKQKPTVTPKDDIVQVDADDATELLK
jgi:hypothetical protein